MQTKSMQKTAAGGSERRLPVPGAVLLAAAALFPPGGLVAQQGAGAQQDAGDARANAAPPTLDETRLQMDKWLETQQIISKERRDWQQGKEILLSRLELVKNEIAALQEKIKQAEASVAEAGRKRDELAADNDQLKAVGTQLAGAVSGMESGVRKLLRLTPEPIARKLTQLSERMPEEPANPRVSTAERFQNVLGILDGLNKANNEITVGYEVHSLGDGKSTEVQAMYVGLAQAYYVSGNGEAGIGRPTADGWKWQPSRAVAGDVLTALEIVQGKHTPAFVPLPVKLP